MTGAERQRRYRGRQKVKLEQLQEAAAGRWPEPASVPTRDDVLAGLWSIARDRSLPGSPRLKAMGLLLEALAVERPLSPLDELDRRHGIKPLVQRRGG